MHSSKFSVHASSCFSSHLFALLEALVGLMDRSGHLLILQLAQFAVRVSQPGHHASGRRLLDAWCLTVGRVLIFT